MTVDILTAIPPCPSCGGPRCNIAQDGKTPLYECGSCGAIESPLVGIVPADSSDAPPDSVETAMKTAAADRMFEELDDDAPAPPDDEQFQADEDAPAPPEGDEPEPAPPAAAATPDTIRPLMEILPADFPLPVLAKFTPDVRIRQAADADAATLLGLPVVDETSMRVVEACLEQQRAHKSTIELLFKEPCDIANKLHKHLTGLRAEWLQRTEQAISEGNGRVLVMQRRLEREATEARRRAQEEADRLAREQARREAEAARQADAPAPVIQQLELEAETATAPPVQATSTPAPTLRSSTVVPNWKGFLKSTDKAAVDLQPEMANLTPALREDVKTAMRAVLEGKAPITVFEINWSVVDKRAKADKKTFAIPGFVAEDIGGIRAKPGRRR